MQFFKIAGQFFCHLDGQRRNKNTLVFCHAQLDLIDDIIDSGGTLCNAAQALLDDGAESVAAYITHGVLSNGAVDRVGASVLKSLVITDSIEPTDQVKAAKNIRIVPTAPIFAQAILNIWNGTSVSSLFETETLVPIYEGMYNAAP